MAESRLFMLNGVDVQAVVSWVEGFFRAEKAMEVQSSRTTDGFVIQASQPKNGWKTISGTRLAITVQMSVTGEQLNVMIGEGQWADKIGAGALGWFIAWPLAITAGVGIAKQKKLPGEVFTQIERCIMSGGRSIAVTSAGVALATGMAVCPNCRTQIPMGVKFCNRCGAQMNNQCPECGADIAPDSMFCSSCGKKL